MAHGLVTCLLSNAIQNFTLLFEFAVQTLLYLFCLNSRLGELLSIFRNHCLQLLPIQKRLIETHQYCRDTSIQYSTVQDYRISSRVRGSQSNTFSDFTVGSPTCTPLEACSPLPSALPRSVVGSSPFPPPCLQALDGWANQSTGASHNLQSKMTGRRRSLPC